MTRVVVLALALVFAAGSSAHAQYSVLAEFYGRGVHAYNSGDYLTAYDYLSKAIDGGFQDPRAYYFRGLTSVASGREYEAEADYRAGADIEAKGGFGPSIGQALTRIQGSHRLQIESMRQQARLDFQSTAAARSRARYQELMPADAGQARPAAPAVPRVTQPVAPPAAPPVAENPFNDAPAGAPVVDAPDALEGTEVDPFADDAAPAAPGAATEAPADDPFGAPSAAPAAGDDPFGADPFGN